MEIINSGNISEENIAKWNLEILEYNQLHDGSNELSKAPLIVKQQIGDASNYLLQNAYNMERVVTNDLLSILTNNGYFVELENRFKSRKRLEEKIYHKYQRTNNEIISIANNIGDVLRYTIIFDYDNYIQNVQGYLENLEELGYNISVFKNRWNEVYFKGISVKINGPCGMFEIQFHTKENYEIKEVFSREPYKLTRKSNAPIDLLIKAFLLRRIYQQKVRIPLGAIEYQYKNTNKKVYR